MQVLVGGMPANEDVSTDVWQYRQSMPSSSDVMQVTELHGLLDVLVGARHIGGAPDQHGDQDRPAGQHEHAGETELGKGIGAAVEDLGHRRLMG